MSIQQMLFAASNLPSFTFRGATEAEADSGLSVTIGAPSGTVSGDFQLLFVWQDTLQEPTFSEDTGIGGAQWTKIGQDTFRPALGVFYSTADTGSVTINGASYTAGAGEDWNAVRLCFTPDRAINSIYASVVDFDSSTGSYSHQISPPSDGAIYTYIHAWGVSGRPRNNTAEPASISRQPGSIDEPNEVINSDSDAIVYYEIYSPGDTVLGTYTYNNINDSGRQSSCGVWIGFT